MITFENEQNLLEVGDDLIEAMEETIEFTLKDQRVSYEGEVSVLLVDNETIREINKENRNIDKSTDVLSFPMIEYEEGKTYKDLYADHEFGAEFFDGDALVLGDIVISMEMAALQADEYGHSLKREVCYLTVHSALHLLGYDHMNETDKQAMRETEERILGSLKITRDLEG